MLGILDSGICGLGVVRKIMERLPDCGILYLGDTVHAPYGDKSSDSIIRHAILNRDVLLSLGARAVFIVSHSIACVAGTHLRESTDVPLLDVVTPVVRKAISIGQKGSFGVIGSRAVIDSNYYPEALARLNPDARVYSEPCPILSMLVEEGWLKKPETARIVKKYLFPLKTRQIDSLILANNHYVFLEKIIQRKIGLRVKLIEAGNVVPAALEDFLNQNDTLKKALLNQHPPRFLVSDLGDHLRQSAKHLFGRNIELELLAYR